MMRASIHLGRRSLRPAAWILVTVSLVNFARATLMGEFLRGNIAISQEPDLVAMLASTFLSLIVFSVLSAGFIYLLPIQDFLERGQTVGAHTAVRVVLHRAAALTASSLAQAVIALGPPVAFVCIIATRASGPLFAAGGPRNAEATIAFQEHVMGTTMAPSFVWLSIANLLLVFAIPLLLLENRGPLRSIGLSAALVLRRVIPDWPRFLSIAFLWAALYAIVVLPESAIVRAVAPLPWRSLVRSLLPAGWSAASTTLSLVFGTAGLVVLFRRLVPPTP